MSNSCICDHDKGICCSAHMGVQGKVLLGKLNNRKAKA